MRTVSSAERIRADLADSPVSKETYSFIRAWLAADAEFNHWFLETTKGQLDDESLMELLSGYGEDQDAVDAAWKAFRADGDVATLAASFEASRARMNALKEK